MRCAYPTVIASSYYEKQYYEEKKENQTICCATIRVETLIESFYTENIFCKTKILQTRTQCQVRYTTFLL